MIKNLYLYLVYSHIWLNLRRDDPHNFLHLPMEDHHFGCREKFPKNTLNRTISLDEIITTDAIVKID